MADTTTHAPGGPGPSPENEPRPAGTTVATGRVRFPLVRWVLAPRPTRQAHRLPTKFGPGMDARTAWAMTRLARHPEERAYALLRLDGEENAG